MRLSPQMHLNIYLLVLATSVAKPKVSSGYRLEKEVRPQEVPFDPSFLNV